MFYWVCKALWQSEVSTDDENTKRIRKGRIDEWMALYLDRSTQVIIRLDYHNIALFPEERDMVLTISRAGFKLEMCQLK